ncbi:MAG: flagellar hook-basal body complex protein [Lachnospiraceae bacterium]|nr:flagellar hook-basal body complex protein [Lachnospiraceae bacterium]
MVRSMVAGVSGLRTHQSKLDVIGNNIANVNTWGFKSSSFNFTDAMYSTSIAGASGSVLGGGAGGKNASQVGYGVGTGSIQASFGQGAMSPSGNSLDCMIDGTGFFLVGNMVNGSFTNVEDSGLSLSRIGIFRVDGNGYLVDDQANYVYGYALEDGTGVPEKPAVNGEYNITSAPVTIDTNSNPNKITIGGVETELTSKGEFKDKVQEWIADVTKTGQKYENYNISLVDFNETANPPTVNLRIVAKKGGDNTANDQDIINNNTWGTGANVDIVSRGSDRVPGVPAKYSDELSAIQIPIDPDTGLPYEIQSYKINEDGTIMGVDNQSRSIAIGQLALITVENLNGLEKSEGYYYSIGPNAGTVSALKPNGGPAGKIRGGYLEMANVDLANEFSQMITTQRGYQANSKIITVTDQMLEELVNMKR